MIGVVSFVEVDIEEVIEEEDFEGDVKYDVGIKDGYDDGSLWLNEAGRCSGTAESNEADLLLLFDESDIIFFSAFCFGDSTFERGEVFAL